MEVQIVYEGVLELGFDPESTSSRDWKSRLFVLKHDPKTKRSTLDFYKDTKKRWQKQVAKGLISLWPTFHLSLAHVSLYKFPIKLVTSDGQQPFYLAAPDFQTMNVWYNQIQSQLTLDNLFPDKKGCREYRVQVAETNSAKLIGAKGESLLVLSKGDLYLASASSKKILGVWPYDSLRRYYCIEGMFGFVAGRRSPRGEGEFKFVTSQKEDIYHRLERAILRAKRGSQGSTSSSEEAKAVDSRPPAPLPSSQQLPPRQETPVQTSESDEEIFRSSPTFSPPTLKGIMTDPPASEISPAYGRFDSNSSGQRVGGGGGRGRSSPWLHESVSCVPQPQESIKKPSQEPQVPKRPPLPPSRNSQISMGVPVASEEDTYSHTVHPIPEQFKNKEHDVVGGSMYNALVHQRPQNAHGKRSSRPTSDADANLYDVAFPEGRKVISSGDYAIARHPDTPQYTPGGVPHLPPRRMASVTKVPLGRDAIDGPREAEPQPPQEQQSQEATKPLPPLPAPLGEVEKQKNGEDDGMTSNPMYGSQDCLLTEVAILNMNEQIRDLDLHVDSSVPEGYSGREVHTCSGAAGVLAESLEMVDDDDDQEFTPNPIYGDLEEEQMRRFVGEERRTKVDMSSCTEEANADRAEGERHGHTKGEACQDVEEDKSLLSECDQGMAAQSRQERETSQLSTMSTLSSTSEQSTASASEGGIQRNAKGYSKVDKSKKASNDSTSGGEAAGNSTGDSQEGSIEVPSALVPMLESQNSNGGTPPPLPERNYSFDESELNQPPVINGGNET